VGTGDDDVAEDLGGDRDRLAGGRDQNAEAQDDRSEARDEAAAARDDRAESREDDSPWSEGGASADRAAARRDRAEGADDRSRAASDRRSARFDRQDAATDREDAAAEQARMSLDELTGAFNRGPGFADLEREMARSRRTGKPLTLAFVDVDGLKERNDTQGHAAGDQVLREAADRMRSHFRPYDLMIRYGGDEFVYVLFDMEPTEALDRFSKVNADLGESHNASLTIGVAVLTDEDEAKDLLRRADADMYRERQA